jgi:hypothetical protein
MRGGWRTLHPTRRAPRLFLVAAPSLDARRALDGVREPQSAPTEGFAALERLTVPRHTLCTGAAFHPTRRWTDERLNVERDSRPRAEPPSWKSVACSERRADRSGDWWLLLLPILLVLPGIGAGTLLDGSAGSGARILARCSRTLAEPAGRRAGDPRQSRPDAWPRARSRRSPPRHGILVRGAPVPRIQAQVREGVRHSLAA